MHIRERDTVADYLLIGAELLPNIIMDMLG